MPISKSFKNHDLFIFDWDGTLNSMRLTMRINESLKRALHVWNTDSTIKDVDHMDYDLKKKLKREGQKNNISTFLFEIFLNFSRPKLHNGTVKLISTLHEKGKKVALFSNGRGARILKELSYLGLSESFDYIISARDIRSLKPNPTGLKITLKATHTNDKKAVYIGDMVDDIITAKFGHVDSCAVASGFDSYHKLKSARPDFIFRSLEEMIATLN